MISLGIDHRRYVEFTMLTPSIERFAGGPIRYSYGDGALDNLTDQDYRKCRLFVIKSTLQGSKTEAAIDAWERSRAGTPGQWHSIVWMGRPTSTVTGDVRAVVVPGGRYVETASTCSMRAPGEAGRGAGLRGWRIGRTGRCRRVRIGSTLGIHQ